LEIVEEDVIIEHESDFEHIIENAKALSRSKYLNLIIQKAYE